MLLSKATEMNAARISCCAVHCTDPGATFSLQKHDKTVPDGEIAFVAGALQGAAAPDPKMTPCVTVPYAAASPSCFTLTCMQWMPQSLPTHKPPCDSWTCRKTYHFGVRQIHRSAVPIDRERAAARWMRPPCGVPSLATFLHSVHSLMTPEYPDSGYSG